MMKPRDTGNGILDLFGNLRFERTGRCAELRNQYGDDRNVNVRITRDRQLDEAEVSDRRDRQSDDNGSDRVSDRPCRDIHCHSLSPSISSTSKIVPVAILLNDVPRTRIVCEQASVAWDRASGARACPESRSSRPEGNYALAPTVASW